jgi:hypothetical protein
MSIKSLDNLLELIKEEIKADANAVRSTEQFNANLMCLKVRVNARRKGTWHYAALKARYIRTRVSICTVNSHFVYPVNARWTNALSALVI